MSEKPILFSAPMIRAIMDGRKSQTRRILKETVPPAPAMDAIRPENIAKHPTPYLDSYCGDRKTKANPRGMSLRWCWWTRDDRQCLPTFGVRWVPGDQLWVRETFARVGDNDDDIHACPDLRVHAYYRADSIQPEVLKWRPSIFMPHWASRLTLEVIAVKVERLQDISEADARAEGIECRDGCWGTWDASGHQICGGSIDPIEAYRCLWLNINGVGSWEANPWVVAVSFKRIDP